MMLSANYNKTQRQESECSLAAISAVAAATNLAQSGTNSHTERQPLPNGWFKKKPKPKVSKKRIENELNPLYGVQPFIAKLYEMISSCDRDKPNIASWADNGQAFVVKDPKAFAAEIMPNYMQTRQFESFIRNLNFYDFHKIHALPIPNGPRDPKLNKHVKYRHPCFQRYKLDLVREIKRSTRKMKHGGSSYQDKDVEAIRNQVRNIENSVSELAVKFEMEINRMTSAVANLESIMREQESRSPLPSNESNHYKLYQNKKRPNFDKTSLSVSFSIEAKRPRTNKKTKISRKQSNDINGLGVNNDTEVIQVEIYKEGTENSRFY